MTLTLTPVDPVADLDLIHGWVSQERARFWGMTDHTRAEVGEVYAYLDSLETHHAYLVRDDGSPVAIFQTYEPAADPMGESYDVQVGDLGVHLFLAPTDNPVRGFTARLALHLLETVFADPAVQRIVVEPDVRNALSLARAERSGVELGPVVQLADKQAQLGFLTRATYEAQGTSRTLPVARRSSSVSSA